MTLQKKGYKQWFDKYQKEKRVEKRRNTFIYFLALIILSISSFLIYYSWIDELKFIGTDIKLIKAKIIDEKRTHVGEGLYIQLGTCEYIFNQKKYTSQFKTSEFKNVYNPKEFKAGDTITIKISVKNPEKSKFIK